jgi:hypothetical protein
LKELKLVEGVEEFKVESLVVYAFREFRIEKFNSLGFKPLAVPFFILHFSFFIFHFSFFIKP